MDSRSQLNIKGSVIQRSGTMFVNAGKLYIDGDYLIESDMVILQTEY